MLLARRLRLNMKRHETCSRKRFSEVVQVGYKSGVFQRQPCFLSRTDWYTNSNLPPSSSPLPDVQHQEPRYSEGPKPPQPSEAGERVVGSAKRRASSAGGITQSRRRASSLPFGRALDFHLGSLGTSRDVAVALNAADAVPVIAASKRSGESRHRNVEADDVPTVAASNNPGNNKVGNSTGAGGGEQPLGNITRHASFEGKFKAEKDFGDRVR